MPKAQDLKLCKLPPKHDPRTLRLEAYLAPAPGAELPTPPTSLDPTHGLRRITWGMLGNDTYGDCTCAAAAHMAKLWARMAGAKLPRITAQHVLKFYFGVTGGQDTGAYILDVLNAWRHDPSAFGGIAPMAFVSLTPANFQVATWLFGGLDLGVNLPLSAQQELNDRAAWSATTDEPGTWGGHSVDVKGYDESGVHLVTWGRDQYATWPWIHAYCDERWALIPNDWQGNPNFDMTTLEADLARLGKVH